LQILPASSGASDADLLAGTGMKPRELRATGQNDLFKARLDQIIDMTDPRVRLTHPVWTEAA
jgi:hypothetical protein